MIPMLLWVTLVSIATTTYYELYQTKDDGMFVLVSKDYIQPFLLTSLYLSLLLVHRVSSSFERWYVGIVPRALASRVHTEDFSPMVENTRPPGGVLESIGGKCTTTSDPSRGST